MVQKELKNSYLLMSGQRRLVALKRLGAKKISVLLVTKCICFVKTKYRILGIKLFLTISNRIDYG